MKNTTQNLYKYSYLIAFLCLFGSASAQTIKQEKMAQLSFMIGDWVGTSKLYENGATTSEVPAYQKISYDLDSSIIVIELKSELLQLHTIIYYDEAEESYVYNPFSKNGVRKLPAQLKDGQFVVSSGNEKRFVFSRISEGHFREYGEKLVDGQWIKYFEDTFKDLR